MSLKSQPGERRNVLPFGSGDMVLYDTTLRDGAQTPGVSFSLQDKLRVTGLLYEFGLRYVEGGWPFSNERDMEYFHEVRKQKPGDLKIAAFGMTSRHRSPRHDRNLRAMVEARPDVYTVFGKAWDRHVTDVLRRDTGEYLRTVKKSVEFLKSKGRPVFFDAEHFFDGYMDNAEYAMEVLEAAQEADALVLCDTRGGSFPWDIEDAVTAAEGAFPGRLGIHTHNDNDLALANALAAMRAGAYHVQGTVNGLGERCGNMDLLTLIPALNKMGFEAIPDMRGMKRLSDQVGRISGRRPPENAPYVGRYAFAHKAGVHADAVLKFPEAYEHIPSGSVGNITWFPLSEQAGRSMLVAEARRHGFGLEKEDPVAVELLRKVEEAQVVGDAQFCLMLRKSLSGYREPFEVLNRRVIDSSDSQPEASVKVRVNGDVLMEASCGDGPVNAMDLAFRKALVKYSDPLGALRLVDYVVDLPGSEAGTEAWIDVCITFSYNGREFTSAARSTDILKASEKALTDGYKHFLTGGG